MWMSGRQNRRPSEVEVDFLSLCEGIVHDIGEVVIRGKLLNERQCLDLSSKLSQIIENTRKVKDVGGLPGYIFTSCSRNLYRYLEKAKLLVNQCAEEDWCAAAVFQSQNENSFQEILVDVGSCYYLIIGHAENYLLLNMPNIREVFLREDLLDSSVFYPASVRDIEKDQEELRKRLEGLASDSSTSKLFGYFLRERVLLKQCLARYLLRKLSCTSQKFPTNTSDVCNAVLWGKEIEPSGTWGSSSFLGAGSGASGVCRTQWLGVPCARKEFHGQASKTTFLKEAGILAHLKHPCIVNFICCGNGENKGDCFIAMELMEKSLFDLIEDRNGVHFPLLVVVDIIRQIARGMRYLHDHGVAHRDLKPQNVVVNTVACTHLEDQYYCVKLVDFGMSKTKVEASKSDTISFRGVGTTRYRAPEVHPKAHPRGLGKANWFKADVYSFAMTCAHVLSLKTPFEDMEELSELYTKLLGGQRPELPRDLPEDLVGLVVDCWNTNCRLRPSFRAICKKLEILECKILGENLTANGDGERELPRSSVDFEIMLYAHSPIQNLPIEYFKKKQRHSNGSNKCPSTSYQTSYYTAEDYFVCDEDGVRDWKCTDSIRTIKAFKVAGIVALAISRVKLNVASKRNWCT